MGDDMISNDSFLFLDESDDLKYNNTGSALPGTSFATAAICLAGFLANSIIIIVILCGSLRKYVIMNLLLELAMTDNVYLLLTIEKQRGIFGITFFGPSLLHCRLSTFLLFATSTISSWITVFIALERFIAVYCPFKVQIICTRKKVYLTILVVTFLSCVASVPFFYTCSVYLVQGIPVCTVQGANAMTDLIVLFYENILNIILPISIITIFNILIVKKIRYQRSFRIRSQGHTSTLATGDVGLVSMMTAISVVFIVTCFPVSLMDIYTHFHRYIHGTDIHSEKWLPRLLFLLEVINHCVNFFLYCITGSVFRTRLLEMFKCKSQKRHSQEMMTISRNVV